MSQPTFVPRKDAEPVPGYRLLRQLGRGGFGEVWESEGPGGVPVALKVVQLDSRAAGELRSLELLRTLRHPNLIPIHGIWQTAGCLFIAMQQALCTLMDRLAEHQREKRPGIPRTELHEYMRDAALGIDFLNRQHVRPEGGTFTVQHRDVKPQNLLLVGGGVKVSDFGLARMLERSVAAHSGGMTIAYAPPEFYAGRVSTSSDQYSLAVTYCQLRGGRRPFEGSHAQVMAGHLMNPPDLWMLPPAERPVVARALMKDPLARWPNCRSFVAELRNVNAPEYPPRHPVHDVPTLLESNPIEHSPGPSEGENRTVGFGPDVTSSTRSVIRPADLASALGSSDRANRLLAAEQLAKAGAAAGEHVPALVRLLDDPDSEVCEQAVITLRCVGPPALPLLLEALRGASEQGREAAARCLGGIRVAVSEPTVRGLVEALDDPTDSVRARAAWALGELRARVAIPALVRTCTVSGGAVLWAASTAVARMGEAAIPALLERIWAGSDLEGETVVHIFGQLGSEGKAAIGPLIELFDARHPRARKWAIWSLGGSARPRSPP